jgi:hypothetical protein
MPFFHRDTSLALKVSIGEMHNHLSGSVDVVLARNVSAYWHLADIDDFLSACWCLEVHEPPPNVLVY